MLSRITVSWRVWLGVSLALVLLRALPNLCYPLYRDQATYCLIGENLLHGKLLYRDLWDNKPPGIFFTFAPLVKLFGPVMWIVGVVDVLWLLAISYCIFRFARQYLGPGAAAIAVLFNAAWHCNMGYSNSAQPETFLVLCVFVAWLLLAPGEGQPSWRGFAAGAMLGVAFWYKYNAAAFFPVVVLLPYLDFSGLDDRPRRIRLKIPLRTLVVRAGTVITGFGAIVLGVLAYFWLAGGWRALVEVQFEVLPRYSSMFFARVPHLGYWGIVFTYRYLGVWTEVMLMATLLFGWVRRELRVVVPVVLMGLAGYASTVVQGRFAEFTFETSFPFFAMFWGYVAVKAYEGFRFARQHFSRRRWWLAQGLLWVAAANVVYVPLPEEVFNIRMQYQAFVFWVRNPQRSYVEYAFPHFNDHLHGQMVVIQYLNTHSRPEDTVYVWGTAPLINFLGRRHFPSRFACNLALISPWAPAAWRDELIGDLERTPPRFIVVARDDTVMFISYTWRDSEQCLETYPALAAFIHNRYSPVFNIEDFEVYRSTTD